MLFEKADLLIKLITTNGGTVDSVIANNRFMYRGCMVTVLEGSDTFTYKGDKYKIIIEKPMMNDYPYIRYIYVHDDTQLNSDKLLTNIHEAIATLNELYE